MSVRSAAQEIPAAPVPEPQVLAMPAGAALAASPAARRPRAQAYTFRRALGHSALAHGLTFLALFLSGAGPEVAEGRPARSARVPRSSPSAFWTPSETWSPPDPEPERSLEVTELPEPELRPVEPELAPLLPAPADPELAEPADPLAALRQLPLEPLAALTPPAEPEPPVPGPEAARADSQDPPDSSVASATVDRQPPKIDSSFSVFPDYPPLSRRGGEEGSVLLRIHVAADGRFDVELVESSGHERLDQAALAVVRKKWRFLPATKDGVAVAGSLLHRMTFRIEEE